jgi:hypothetical protein
MSARTDVGIAAQFARGGQFTVDGERSGLGGSFSLRTYRARLDPVRRAVTQGRAFCAKRSVGY